MRKVKLRMNENHKYKVIKELVDHEGNKKRAAIELSITVRQVNRLIIKYREKGKSGFIHGNRSKKPVITLDKAFSDSIILFYSTKYQGFNYKHFHDKLIEVEGLDVSYSALYRVLTQAKLYSPKIRRKTRKGIVKQKILESNQSLNEQEIEIQINHILDIEDCHPRRERKKYFGEEIQMDASQHIWFGNSKTQLHLAIDDATGIIVGGYFDKQETLFGYYNVYKQILENYGIPYAFKTDNRTIFNYISAKMKSPDKDVLTQFGYACKILGTDLQTTSVSQAKGRIERANGTFQGRLINELRLEGITTIDKANEYLMNVFIPDFNKRFGAEYKKFESVFETSPDKEKINYTLAVIDTRQVDNGNSIKYKSEYYQAYQDDQIICIKPKTEVLVIKAFDGEMYISIDDQVFEMRKLERNSKTSEAMDLDVKAENRKKKHIPPANHPWKVSIFKNHVKNSHDFRIFT